MIYGFEVTAAGANRSVIVEMRKWRSTPTGYNSAAKWHNGNSGRELYEAPPGFKFSRRTYKAYSSVDRSVTIEDYYRATLLNNGKRIDGWIGDYKGSQ